MMKAFQCLIAALSLVLTLSSIYAVEGKTPPNNYVVFISPNLEDSKKQELFKEFSYWIIGGTGKATDANFGMKPKDTLQIFDGGSLRSLLSRTFVMPAECDTPKKRLKATEEVRAAINKFLSQKQTEFTDIDVPKIASAYKQMVDAKDARVLFIGSPLYHDDVDAHDMAGVKFVL